MRGGGGDELCGGMSTEIHELGCGDGMGWVLV